MNKPNLRKKSFFSPFAMNVIFIVFILIGLSLIPRLPVRLNPSKKIPRIYIQYSYFNATPEIVEKQVTSRLEGVFETVKGVENIKSTSGFGWGQIQLDFSDKINAQIFRFEILSRIREIYPSLPKEVTYPQVMQAGSNTDEQVQLITYMINGNTCSYALYNYLNTHVQPLLTQIDGILKTEIYGSTPYVWEIEYELSKLKKLNITKNEIRQAVSNYFKQTDVGYNLIKTNNNAVSLMLMTSLVGQNKNPRLLPQIPIKKVVNRIIYLNDLAKVNHKQKQQQSFYRINGLTAVNMVVYADKEANQISLAKKVKAKMQQIEENLPNSYSLTIAYDSSVFLEKEINKTFWRTLFSIVILLMFVLLISRSFRYLLIIVITLFANLSIAIFFYYILKIEIHLYSLAGITVSLGILIDNSIIMVDHIWHKNNRQIFLAIMAATLTTVGALFVIFFLEKEQQINLLDFAWVIVINLLVSLGIALFFIPSVMEKIPIPKKQGRYFFRRKRKVLKFNRFYKKILQKLTQWRLLVLIVGVLIFGLPVFMIPTEITENVWYKNIYNKTLGSDTYIGNIKPIVDKALGGTLRLFVEHLREENYFSSPRRTALNVRVKLPQGASINHLNDIYVDFENYLTQFSEIDFFQTNINSFENSRLVIYFKKKYDYSTFPFLLKSRLESKAIHFSSADFSIFGVGRGFSNALYSGFKNSKLIFSGYNYEQLLKHTHKAKNMMLKSPRISKIFIESGNAWWFYDSYNTYFEIDKSYLALNNTSIINFVSDLKTYGLESEHLLNIPFNNDFESLELISGKAKETDLWLLKEQLLGNNKCLKFKKAGKVYSQTVGKSIYRENQQYILTLAYDFIGPSELGRIELEKYEEEVNKNLPVGYKAKIPTYSGYWNVKNKNQYLLLILMITIVYFICAILLESLIQPLLVIAMIPLSCVGIFVMFYVGGFKFDQGGYASFLLVSGLVVNSALYILNDFNNTVQKRFVTRRLSKYLRAYNYKIIPVLLTIASTILGLLPFVFWQTKEPFWFALAIGTIGGLICSIPAIFVFLPLMIKKLTNKIEENG